MEENTQQIAEEYAKKINVGDIVFDNVTKVVSVNGNDYFSIRPKIRPCKYFGHSGKLLGKLCHHSNYSNHSNFLIFGKI